MECHVHKGIRLRLKTELRPRSRYLVRFDLWRSWPPPNRPLESVTIQIAHRERSKGAQPAGEACSTILLLYPIVT